MNTLYPLKFNRIVKESVWGSEKWLLSALEGDLSIVANGALKGNNINELVEIYLGDLIGEPLYEKYGEEFPLLVKILDIEQPLSLQIHPNDATAAERHNAYGKHECWYIKKAKEDAKIHLGLKRELTMEELYNRSQDGTIEQELNILSPNIGEVIDIPPGTLHSAQGGLEVIEIQQTSDITYRVYDWGRESTIGRQIDLDLAIDCVDYGAKEIEENLFQRESCITEHFELRVLDGGVERYASTEIGFIIYIPIEENYTVEWRDGTIELYPNEVILIPASLGRYKIEGR
ncbi:MAG: type I phosphomannose isomerase catalytic subunit, partial [Bacteroidales bacterium]